MKKTIALLLALVLALSLCLTALAADQSGETRVSATVESSYTLTIPSDQSIAFGATKTDLSSPLKVTGNVGAGKTVTVTAVTQALTCPDQDTVIPFTLQKDGAAFTSEVWTDEELRADTPKELTLSVVIAESDWNAAKAGAYAGSIVFSAALG